MNVTRELETLFLIILASIIGLFAVYTFKTPSHHYAQTPVNSPLPTFVLQPTATPTPPPFAPTTTTTSWGSSDGTENVVMDKTINKDTTVSYTFWVKNTSTNTSQTFFHDTVANSSSFTIPFNTVSPDNNYLFLIETIGGTAHSLVFKSSGQNFTNGELYLDVTSLFGQYTTADTLFQVTGWADPTLLVVNAKTADGSLRSFWFDVTTHSFVPLAHTFE